MHDQLTAALQARKNKTISLGELEKMFDGNTSYEEFAERVRALEEAGILQPVKKHGFTPGARRLANTYRILKPALSRSAAVEIEKYQFIIDHRISLEDYYSLPIAEWEKDLPFIRTVNAYLQENGLTGGEATAPEWSYRLAGDEKWIENGHGKTVLKRLGLWNDLKIVFRPEPLMLALNPGAWSRPLCRILIIENKSPFYALLEALPGSDWLAIVYGAGWKITADITMLEKQLGREQETLEVYYFGDLDYEGISIWHALSRLRRVNPALDFYRAVLDKPRASGKTGQRPNRKALLCFLSYFSPGERRRITEVLENGAYYPQEILSPEELAEIGGKIAWK